MFVCMFVYVCMYVCVFVCIEVLYVSLYQAVVTYVTAGSLPLPPSLALFGPWLSHNTSSIYRLRSVAHIVIANCCCQEVFPEVSAVFLAFSISCFEKRGPGFAARLSAVLPPCTVGSTGHVV